MTDPITPPPELVQQWCNDDPNYSIASIATRAAQWGADAELEASVSWLIENQNPRWAQALRAARRPKSPSLKEQALALIDDCTDPEGDYLDDNALSIIRRALEALPDD